MQPIEAMKFVNLNYPSSTIVGAATAVTVTDWADTKGWGHLRVLLIFGDDYVALTAAPQLQHSDVTASGFTDITLGVLAAAPTATADGYMYAIDVDLTKGTIKRFVKCLATKGTDTTGTGLAILGILSRPCSGSMGGGYAAANLSAAVVQA